MSNTRLSPGRVLRIFSLVGAILPIASVAQLSEVDLDAIHLLRQSTEYLSSLRQFRVETDTTIEAVLPAGQKLQFGHRVAVTVQRPDKLRVDRVGDLISQVFYYDGESLSVNLPDDKYYATVPAPPTIEPMLDFARDKLDVIAPGADFVYKNAFERLSAGLTSAVIVGRGVVGGVRCYHIAFRNPEVDWQIWIQEGDKPLPRKFIVTSKRMPESPQFVVVMSKWDAAPKLTDAMFRFAPPKGSRQIEFLSPALAVNK